MWHTGSDEELVRDARLQSRPTHAYPRSLAVCASTVWSQGATYASFPIRGHGQTAVLTRFTKTGLVNESARFFCMEWMCCAASRNLISHADPDTASMRSGLRTWQCRKRRSKMSSNRDPIRSRYRHHGVRRRGTGWHQVRSAGNPTRWLRQLRGSAISEFAQRLAGMNGRAA